MGKHFKIFENVNNVIQTIFPMLILFTKEIMCYIHRPYFSFLCFQSFINADNINKCSYQRHYIQVRVLSKNILLIARNTLLYLRWRKNCIGSGSACLFFWKTRVRDALIFYLFQVMPLSLQLYHVTGTVNRHVQWWTIMDIGSVCFKGTIFNLGLG